MGPHARLDARVDAIRDDLVALLESIVGIDSTTQSASGHGSRAAGGERAVNELLEERYRAAGLETSWVSADPKRPNLIGTSVGSGGGRSLALNAHVDTAAPLDPTSWSSPPWTAEVVDGRIRGLGSVESKASAVVMWAVAQVLHDEGVDLAGRLQLHSVVGGASAEHELGTSAVLDAGHTADAAIALAPTSSSGRLGVAPVAAGTMTIDVDVLGKVTHCGNRPRAIRPGGQGDAIGVNALEKGMAMLDALSVLEDRWGITKTHPGFSPGFFTIGVATFRSDAGFAFPAYFPDHASIQLLVTYPPGERPDAVVDEIDAHLRASSAADPWLVEHPPTVESVEVRPPMRLDRAGQLANTLAAALGSAQPGDQDLTQPERREALMGTCDGAFYAQRGIPVVAFGPGDRLAARRRDESIAVDELTTAAKALLRAVVAWCARTDR